jgi:hypothetical protein
MRQILAIVLVALSGPALAQSSAGYILEEHVFNAGGHPEAGTVLTSASYRMSLDALGDAVLGTGLGSASYHMDGGFGSAYPPPGEVTGLLLLDDDETLVWDPERSVGVYHLYRDLLSALSGLGYGQCEQYGIATETATDSDTPSASTGYFYLVTAENRLAEEGTKGWDSSDDERLNPSPCP